MLNLKLVYDGLEKRFRFHILYKQITSMSRLIACLSAMWDGFAGLMRESGGRLCRGTRWVVQGRDGVDGQNTKRREIGKGRCPDANSKKGVSRIGTASKGSRRDDSGAKSFGWNSASGLEGLEDLHGGLCLPAILLQTLHRERVRQARLIGELQR